MNNADEHLAAILALQATIRKDVDEAALDPEALAYWTLALAALTQAASFADLGNMKQAQAMYQMYWK